MIKLFNNKLFSSIIALILLGVGGYVLYGGLHSEPDHTPDITAAEYASNNQPSVGPTKIHDHNAIIDSKTMNNNSILIPSISAYANINYNNNAGLIEDHEFVLPLANEVTQWQKGSKITDKKGNIVIAGHVSWNGAPGALYNLAKVPLGGIIYVSDAKHNVVKFQLQSKIPYKKVSLPKSIWNTNKDKELIVITCGGKLHRIDGAWHFDSNIVTSWKPVK